MRNFSDVTKQSEELLDLTLQEVLDIFGDDELNVKNEEVVWEAAIRWIGHDAENRKQYIVELLRKIRTGLMETQYFMEHVKEHFYVHGNEGCRQIIIETLRFLYEMNSFFYSFLIMRLFSCIFFFRLQFTSASPLNITEQIPTPGIAKPRIPHEILFAIGGWSGGSPTSFIETYDTRYIFAY
jgi:kelch-like protein 10